jgi:hypothetical protein
MAASLCGLWCGVKRAKALKIASGRRARRAVPLKTAPFQIALADRRKGSERKVTRKKMRLKM